MSSGSFWGIIAISGCIGLSVLYWTRVYCMCVAAGRYLTRISGGNGELDRQRVCEMFELAATGLQSAPTAVFQGLRVHILQLFPLDRATCYSISRPDRLKRYHRKSIHETLDTTDGRSSITVE
jgi:hypothetical protein